MLKTFTKKLMPYAAEINANLSTGAASPTGRRLQQVRSSVLAFFWGNSFVLILQRKGSADVSPLEAYGERCSRSDNLQEPQPRFA